MSAIVLTDAFVKVDTTDISGQATSVAIAFSANAVDVTAMGSGTKVNQGGLY
jgi:hypothetical protein